MYYYSIMKDRTWEHLVSYNTNGGKRLNFSLVHFHKDDADSMVLHVAMGLSDFCNREKILRYKINTFLSLYDEYRIKKVELFDSNDDENVYTYCVELKRK